MKHIKRVPIETLSEHLGGTRMIAVEHNGEVVGHFVPRVRIESTRPANPDLDWNAVRPEERESVRQWRTFLREIYAETGMTEDELADFMDPTLGCVCDDCTGDGKS